MKVESITFAGGTPMTQPRATEKLEAARKEKESASSEPKAAEKQQIPPEEMLQQIKALTEDGTYSVRFENDNEANAMVVKVVDRETDEVIRQIPPEELLELTKRLTDLRGNIVDMQS